MISTLRQALTCTSVTRTIINIDKRFSGRIRLFNYLNENYEKQQRRLSQPIALRYEESNTFFDSIMVSAYRKYVHARHVEQTIEPKAITSVLRCFA